MRGIKNILLALVFGAGGALGFGCASDGGKKPNLNHGFDIIENTAIKRTKVNVGTGSGEGIQMVLVEEPGGGKWIENNAGAVVYRWDAASSGWRPTSNQSLPLKLKITAFVEEKIEADEFGTPAAKEKITNVVYGSTTYKNARVVEIDSRSAVIYDEEGVKIFEKANGKWYKITTYGIAIPIEGLNIGLNID